MNICNHDCKPQPSPPKKAVTKPNPQPQSQPQIPVNAQQITITQDGNTVQVFYVGQSLGYVGQPITLTQAEQSTDSEDGIRVEKIDSENDQPLAIASIKEEVKSDDDLLFVSATSMAVEEDPPFDPELHKWAVDDKMVECFMKGCNYQDSFSNVISHLRKGKILA